MEKPKPGIMLRLLPVLLALLLPLLAPAQATVSVSGTVLDEEGEPLIGASVKAQGAEGVSAVTDIDGAFAMKIPPTVKALEISYVGYTPVTVAVGSDPLLVRMTPDAKVMSEVVVIGYGVQKKTDLTGAVSTVGAKDFNKGMISSPEELINGKIAGVQIVNAGGSPNSGSTIRVRGGASLNASNDPLIVLDGVPMEVGGGVSGSGNFLSLINPNDIETMTVLKDASSTAIYGSRASNGVIIITTKKGGGDKVKVSFQTTNSLSTRTKTADMLTRGQFVDAYRAWGTPEQQALLGSEDTDWNGAVYHTAYGTDNSLSVSGRASFLPYRVALGAMSQDGILRTDNSTRYTANVNLTPSFLGDRLRLNISGKGTYSRNRFADTGTIWTAAVADPTQPVYGDPSLFGGYNEVYDSNMNPAQGGQPNPLGKLLQYDSRSEVWRLIGNVDVDYSLRLVPGLRLHATGGCDYSRGKGTVVVPECAYSYYTTGGRDYTYGPQTNNNRLLTVYANYNTDLDAIRSTLDVTVGYDYQHWKYATAAYDQYSYTGNYISSSAASDQRHSLISYYGRVNYAYDGRYLLTATFRRDGSSRFAKDHRWGTFPSVALAWRVSGESFWERLQPVVNDLKLRASYGVTGQQDGIANYGYLPVYTIGQSGAQYPFDGAWIDTYRPEAYNPNLKWETTRSWNAGVDLAFLNNRFTLTADWYTRKTEDLLATVPMPAGVNFDKVMLTNVGNVDSKGVELALTANIVSTSDWAWTLTANATWQDSKITNLTLVPGADSPDTGVGPTLDSTHVQVFSTGHRPYAYYVYKQIYDEATGRPVEGLYADLNGDGAVNTGDLYHYHSPSPDWILGLSTSLRFRRLTLSTSLRANIGNYVYNGMAANMGAWECTTWCAGQLNNLSSSFLETNFKNRQYLSDHYVENGSFLKMDNLQLTYDFGAVGPLTSLHASAMVQNVFTWTKYKGVDPESQTGVDTSVYPRPRTYSLTIGLTL